MFFLPFFHALSITRERVISVSLFALTNIRYLQRFRLDIYLQAIVCSIWSSLVRFSFFPSLASIFVSLRMSLFEYRGWNFVRKSVRFSSGEFSRRFCHALTSSVLLPLRLSPLDLPSKEEEEWRDLVTVEATIQVQFPYDATPDPPVFPWHLNLHRWFIMRLGAKQHLLYCIVQLSGFVISWYWQSLSCRPISSSTRYSTSATIVKHSYARTGITYLQFLTAILRYAIETSIKVGKRDSVNQVSSERAWPSRFVRLTNGTRW